MLRKTSSNSMGDIYHTTITYLHYLEEEEENSEEAMEASVTINKNKQESFKKYIYDVIFSNIQ